MKKVCWLTVLGSMMATAQAPSDVAGIWLGTLSGGGAKLRVQLQVKRDGAGKLSCALDSLDQGAKGIPCDNLQLEGSQFSFDVPAVKGKWSGTLSADGNQLDGTWTQAGKLPLRFSRQEKALVSTVAAPKIDEAMPPVPLADLKAVLDRDLAAALKDGALSPANAGGVTIGVLQHGARRILAYGPVKEDAILEIGSITKTFTALILARMVEQNKVRLDEPVRDLLPAGAVARPAGAEITLLDLATQHSGLPRLPDNLRPANLADPYASYSPKDLYHYLDTHGVGRPANPAFNYSNLGFGLLGQALADRAGAPYPALLAELATGPLHLTDTVVNLSAEQEKRFAQGHSAQHLPVGGWTFQALAGAGAIRSTAADLLTYLAAQLHPDTAPAGMRSALALCHELRADVTPGARIALAWIFDSATGDYWHDGGTGGYSAYAAFNPRADYAVAVLFNTTIRAGGSFADDLGRHIIQRLTGKPALALHD